jgi:hypothetical protein
LLPHRGIHPCRKVEFYIKSHDQGWGGSSSARGTYNGSYTWFDAFIIPKSQENGSPKEAGEKAGSTGTSGNTGPPELGTQLEGNNQPNNDTAHTEQHGGSQSSYPDPDSDAELDESPEPDSQFNHRHYFLPGPDTLQRNQIAIGKSKSHVFVWHYLDVIDPDSAEAEETQNSQGRGRATLDGKAVREMNVGDQISIWARARFPGWVNHVQDIRVRVFWAI